VRDAWNLRVVDMYSAKEAGPIALQCPLHDHYHEQSEAVLVEILDAEGRACAPGETGRVVLTSLHNFAAPLIRYEIGDLAERGPACGCGRALPVIARILGRRRNMLHYPDGSARWPSLGEAGLAAVFARAPEMPPVEQFQLVQHSTTRLEARLVVARPYTPAEETLLADYLRTAFGPHWQIAFSYPAAIERGPGGKFEDFLSHVAPGAATAAS
jgi:phenylacetate-CoA ligase